MSVLILGLSYWARNVLSYTWSMMQNFLAFRDSIVLDFKAWTWLGVFHLNFPKMADRQRGQAALRHSFGSTIVGNSKNLQAFQTNSVLSGSDRRERTVLRGPSVLFCSSTGQSYHDSRSPIGCRSQVAEEIVCLGSGQKRLSAPSIALLACPEQAWLVCPGLH